MFCNLVVLPVFLCTCIVTCFIDDDENKQNRQNKQTCLLVGGTAVHGAERPTSAGRGSDSRRALQFAEVRRKSTGVPRRRHLVRRPHVAHRLPAVPDRLRQRALHRLHARRAAGDADRAQRAPDGRAQGRPSEATSDAERAPAARQQRDPRPHHRRHRLQRLPVSGARHPAVVELPAAHGPPLRRLPVLLQPRQQRAGRHQLGRQLPHLPPLQQALSLHPHADGTRSRVGVGRQAAPAAHRAAGRRFQWTGSGPRPVEGRPGHRPTVAFSVNPRSSAAANNPRRRPPAVDDHHGDQGQVHRYWRRRLYYRRLKTTLHSPVVPPHGDAKKTAMRPFAKLLMTLFSQKGVTILLRVTSPNVDRFLGRIARTHFAAYCYRCRTYRGVCACLSVCLPVCMLGVLCKKRLNGSRCRLEG